MAVTYPALREGAPTSRQSADPAAPGAGHVSPDVADWVPAPGSLAVATTAQDQVVTGGSALMKGYLVP